MIFVGFEQLFTKLSTGGHGRNIKKSANWCCVIPYYPIRFHCVPNITMSEPNVRDAREKSPFFIGLDAKKRGMERRDGISVYIRQ